MCLDDVVDEDDCGNDIDCIVMCDYCNVAVHQTCYGRDLVPRVPDGSWFCARCLALQDINRPFTIPKCELCPNKKGALVPVGDKWYHISCVNQHKTIWWEETVIVNAIGVQEKVRDTTKLGGRMLVESFDLTCSICKKK